MTREVTQERILGEFEGEGVEPEAVGTVREEKCFGAYSPF